jgi:glutathione S-transferase
MPVNLHSGKQHDDASRAINPQRRVPSLIDGDLTLLQSTAIIEYLL